MKTTNQFKLKGNLTDHEKIHTEVEKPFFCEYCDKKIVLSSHKNVHERIHTGEKTISMSAL